MFKKENFLKCLTAWAPFALIITLLSGMVYVAAQQNYRMNANDPQIQYVESILPYLADGSATAEEVVGTQKIDVANSLGTFVIVFDADKKAVASGATLNDKIPVPPTSVFDNIGTKINTWIFRQPSDQTRFTWEPQKGVRIAAVISPYKKDGKVAGYVLAGRNMREVENRIEQIGIILLAGWIFTMIATYATLYLLAYPPKKSTKKPKTEV